MSALSAFLDYVMPDVPGCTVGMAQFAIRNACIEFCAETQCYQHEPVAINTVAGTRDYVPTLPAGTQVAAVLHVALEDAELFPKSDAQLDALYAVYGVDWRDVATQGDVAYYQMTDPAMGTLRLVLTPDAAVTAGLTVKLALQPTTAATTVADFLLTQYHDAIAHGAKRVLMAMHKKPWSNPNLAGHHGTMFELAKGRADTAAAKGNTRAPLRVSTCYR